MIKIIGKKENSMATRNNTSTFFIGNKKIGGDSPILIQSMSDIRTAEVDKNVELTERLVKLGLDMMRYSVLDERDALALAEIKKRTSVPVIADIHFNANLAMLAIESGVDKIRLNPGNMPAEKIRSIRDAMLDKGIALRIGVNSGSLGKYGKATLDNTDPFFFAIDEMLDIFKEVNFKKIVLSLKATDPTLTIALYKRASRIYPYPLHVGQTESGYSVAGAIRSSVAMVPLLSEGIGNTIRISLSDDRIQEMVACRTMLAALGLRHDIPVLITCPTCGRTQCDVSNEARIIDNYLTYNVHDDIRVAVMGCPVNGPGEAKDADIGLAGGINSYLVFVKGKPVRTLKGSEAVNEFIKMIDETVAERSELRKRGLDPNAWRN